jgi:GlcNAc-P-P-Und epimerase
MHQPSFLLTGGTGFLGTELHNGLVRYGSRVIRMGKSLKNEIPHQLEQSRAPLRQKFDFVVHCAGKAHVIPKNETERQEFFDVNVTGTLNLLNGLKRSPGLPRGIVFISSIAVYGLVRGESIKEDHMLEARDPYGQSKIQAEHLLISWCEEHGVSLAILRLPLVAGMNPPGNLSTMIAGIKKGYYRSIGGGSARKSVVMANDVAAIIPIAMEKPGIYHLTDGYHPSFRELEVCIAKQLNVSPPGNIPRGMAKLIGRAGDAFEILFPGKSPISSTTIAKITSTLTFDDSKARANLGWNPSRVIDAFRLH